MKGMLPALAALLVSVASSPAPRLWLPGEPLGAEAPSPGARVLALCGNALRPQTLHVVDDGLSVRCNATAILDGIPSLRPGRATPARIRTGPYVKASPSGAAFVNLSLYGRTWRIERIRLASTGYRLVLKTPGDHRPPVTLYEAQSTDAARWQLLWAGDLDGDKKLDLLVEASDALDLREVHLFLSKDAEEGVDPIASRRIRLSTP